MVPQFSRRETFRIGGLLTVAAGSDCSTLKADDITAVGQQLGAVSIHNDMPTDVTVAALIIRDGEHVYWQEHEIRGTTTADNTTVNRSTAITPPDFDQGFGRYLVGVRVRETGESSVLDLTDADREDDCYHVVVSLTESGPAFALGTADEYTNCENSPEDWATSTNDTVREPTPGTTCRHPAPRRRVRSSRRRSRRGSR